MTDPFSTTGWTNFVPTGINDNGMIIGTATYTPAPPVAVYAPEYGTWLVPVSVDTRQAGNYGVAAVQTELAVDADRNGTIVLASENNTKKDAQGKNYVDANGNPVDKTTQALPFRFWINDDEDVTTPSVLWSDDDPEAIPATHADKSNRVIDSPRDLEDMSRLWFYTKGFNQDIHDGKTYVGLKWQNVTSGTTPAIRLFAAKETDGGLQYLKNAAVAHQQASDPYRMCPLDDSVPNTPLIPPDAIDAVKPSDRPADFIFKPSAFASLSESNPKTFFLFEGVSEGKGQLTVVFLKKNGVDFPRFDGHGG